jgi:hypothetical protein
MYPPQNSFFFFSLRKNMYEREESGRRHELVESYWPKSGSRAGPNARGGQGTQVRRFRGFKETIGAAKKKRKKVRNDIGRQRDRKKKKKRGRRARFEQYECPVDNQPTCSMLAFSYTAPLAEAR